MDRWQMSFNLLDLDCKSTSTIPHAAGTDTRKGTATVTIACDAVAFVLIPIWIFLPLQMKRQNKILLIVLFVLGFSTVAFSILRAVQIGQVQKDGNNSMLLMWGSVEMNVGVSRSKTSSIPQQSCGHSKRETDVGVPTKSSLLHAPRH